MNISTISQTSGAADLVMEIPTLPENREMDGSISPATRIGQLFIPNTAYFDLTPAFESFIDNFGLPVLGACAVYKGGYLVYKVAEAMYNWAIRVQRNQAKDENQVQAVSNEYRFTDLTRCIDLQ